MSVYCHLLTYAFGGLADQLQRAVERGEYAEAARLLEAVQQLAAHFQAFGSVPKVRRSCPRGTHCCFLPLSGAALNDTMLILLQTQVSSPQGLSCASLIGTPQQVAELSGRVSALQMSLQLSAMREFELLGTGEDKPNPLLLERLRACCLVIDVLGFKVKSETADGLPSAYHTDAKAASPLHFHSLCSTMPFGALMMTDRATCVCLLTVPVDPCRQGKSSSRASVKRKWECTSRSSVPQVCSLAYMSCARV